jgi:hypothetical protein
VRVFLSSHKLRRLYYDPGMSVAHAEMGNKLVDFAATEVHPPLASATRKMGRAWHSYSDLDQAQAISDCVIFGDTLGYQGMNARSAKVFFLRTSALPRRSYPF